MSAMLQLEGQFSKGFLILSRLLQPSVTTIGKREYTPGILEMTAICQLYTRKRLMYDKNVVYDWYTFVYTRCMPA